MPRTVVLALLACGLVSWMLEGSLAFAPPNTWGYSCHPPRILHQHTNKHLRSHAHKRSLGGSGWDWDGDDLRYISRLRRRLRRSVWSGGDRRPIRNGIICVTTLVFVYQTIDAVRWIAKKHPEYWPQNALFMIWDVLIGNASPGPFERDFCFSSRLAAFQPHRYFTCGFLHRGVLHLLLNMNQLLRQPAWLETGLGAALYLTTFLVSIVAGCVGHTIWGGSSSSFILLGISAGICGLYGLMFVSLGKMGKQQSSLKALVGTGIVVLYTSLLLETVSNFAHLGGFLAGFILGLFFGPNYSKSYSMRREWSTYVDTESKEYRSAMGFGVQAKKQGPVPLLLFWIVVFGLMSVFPRYRSVPATILQGLMHSGSLS